MTKRIITYASSSSYKKQEIEILCATGTFDADGNEATIGEHFDFEFSSAKTNEPLEIDLIEMVSHKAKSAYQALLMPCIVEHAGLILRKNYDAGFPGGLTQPMWDALGPEEFLRRTGAAGESVVARAVIGYCDGMSITTFVGETEGVLADRPRGERAFYWDTIFCPIELGSQSYAEIVSDPNKGLRSKMTVSQSYRALRQYLSQRYSDTRTGLFR
jgi:XTP/dITP diphosphohydrolase